MTRPSTTSSFTKQDVDARHKAGHDEEEMRPGAIPAFFCRAGARFTSPRLRGEVEIRAQHEFRVRGTLHESRSLREPLTPTLSPQERGDGAHRASLRAQSRPASLTIAFRRRTMSESAFGASPCA